MNFGKSETSRNLAAMEEYARMGEAAAAAAAAAAVATATFDKSNFSKWSDCSFETPFVPPAAGRDTNALPLNGQEMRKNMFDNSYFSDFKSLQGSVPFSSGNAGDAVDSRLDSTRSAFEQMPMIGKHANYIIF